MIAMHFLSAHTFNHAIIVLRNTLQFWHEAARSPVRHHVRADCDQFARVHSVDRHGAPHALGELRVAQHRGGLQPLVERTAREQLDGLDARRDHGDAAAQG